MGKVKLRKTAWGQVPKYIVQFCPRNVGYVKGTFRESANERGQPRETVMTRRVPASPSHDAFDRRVVLRENTSEPITCDEVVSSQTTQLTSQQQVRRTISILDGVASDYRAAAHDRHRRLTKLRDISPLFRADRLLQHITEVDRCSTAYGGI